MSGCTAVQQGLYYLPCQTVRSSPAASRAAQGPTHTLLFTTYRELFTRVGGGGGLGNVARDVKMTTRPNTALNFQKNIGGYVSAPPTRLNGLVINEAHGCISCCVSTFI